jgi:hypothetical protein
MKRISFLSILWIALLLASCSPPATSAPTKSQMPALKGDWTIRMTHSGGIMGLLRSIEVKSDGIYTVKDERGKKDISGQLSKEELANLIQVVDSSTYSRNNEPYGCADCFIYEITITGDGGGFSARVDDISIDKSGLSELVITLRGIIERELQ